MLFESYLGIFFLLSYAGPVVLDLPMPTHTEKQTMCISSALEGCLRKLQTFLRMKELPFTPVQKELDLLCEKAQSGYNCSKMMYANADCLFQKDKDMIPIFMPMAEYMYFMLCETRKRGSGYLREAFLGNSDCILKHKKEIDCCAKETNLPDLPILHFLEQADKPLEIRTTMTCCPISRHLQCVSAIARDKCGEAALDLTSEYILRASGSQVQVVCDKLPDYPETDANTCPDSINTCSGAAFAVQRLSVVVNVVAVIVLVLMWF